MHDKLTKAEDDDEALDGTNRSHGRCAGPVAGGGEYEGCWFGCGCVLGLTSLENNRTCGGMREGLANIGGYVRQGVGGAASHGRRK